MVWKEAAAWCRAFQLENFKIFITVLLILIHKTRSCRIIIQALALRTMRNTSAKRICTIWEILGEKCVELLALIAPCWLQAGGCWRRWSTMELYCGRPWSQNGCNNPSRYRTSVTPHAGRACSCSRSIRGVRSILVIEVSHTAAHNASTGVQQSLRRLIKVKRSINADYHI